MASLPRDVDDGPAGGNDVKRRFTENDVENVPMLRINTDMGYRPLPADVEAIRNLDVDGREERG